MGLFNLFKKKPDFTDADPRVVEFFFAQYLEIVKHGKDAKDDAMKKYLFGVITSLGIPSDAIEDAAEEVQKERPLVIVRRGNGSVSDA